MKENRSLAISNKIQEIKMDNILGLLKSEFPSSILSNRIDETSTRDRVYTVNNTLLTMVMSSIQQDKSLKNAVHLSFMLHQDTRKETIKALEINIEEQIRAESKNTKRNAGRPKKHELKMPKSLASEISLNTAAYSKARKRVPVELTEKLFKASRIENAKNDYSHWQGHKVFIADGTYFQFQDTPELRKKYEVKRNGASGFGYPQGLLEVIQERGTGQLFSICVSNRHTSELALFNSMIDQMPAKSLMLMDDLYNCYEIIAKCQRLKIEIIVPAKRQRNYDLVEQLHENDEIIRIKAPIKKSQWTNEPEKAESLLMRRIQYKTPDGKDHALLTSILDKKIKSEEIINVFLSRWDVEISIREIKTIMDINIVRSKTPEMAMKEIYVALATYNLIRKIIYASTKDLPFFPKEDLISKFYTLNKDVFIDKKGRVYSRWSTGRRRTAANYYSSDATET